MNISIISFTENGRLISKKLYEHRSEKLRFKRFTFGKFTDDESIRFDKTRELVEKLFKNDDALVFVSSCGIAVRTVAPFLGSKTSDPAVVAIDEQGKFAVSLLSGHFGGANALAVKIAEIIGAVPVITTATDIGGKFSPDSFAAANHLYLNDFETAKLIAAEIVNGGKIGFYSDYKYINRPDKFFDDSEKKLGICISAAPKKPFEKTLNLFPKNVIIGVGCKKNTEAKALESFLTEMLEKFGIDIERVIEIHTIDLKKEEAAILSFAEKYGLSLRFYSCDELMRTEGEFSGSDFVKSITGADNVCERSACASGGKLIIGKQSMHGMTFAAAESEVILDFEREIL